MNHVLVCVHDRDGETSSPKGVTYEILIVLTQLRDLILMSPDPPIKPNFGTVALS